MLKSSAKPFLTSSNHRVFRLGEIVSLNLELALLIPGGCPSPLMPKAKIEPVGVQRPKRVTLLDIARIAGVHKMTVSDALNGTRSVAPATRERVRQIAKELNYIPNSAARSLATGRTGIIAVLSGPLIEPYYAHMVHLLEDYLTDSGFNLMLMRTSREVQDLVNATGNTAVDGAIAVDMMGLVHEFRSQSAIPCVSIGTVENFSVDYVIADLSSSVEEALRLMLAGGRRRIAYFVTATHLAKPTEVRARTYLAVMQEAKQRPEIINVKSDQLATVEERFKTYIQKNGCPDALFCQNDETAMCIFRVLKSLGHRVPEDVLLVGCDGQKHMEYLDPPLSTIVQPMEEMCAVAWQFLRQRMADPSLPLQGATFQGKLLVRQSLLGDPPPLP